MEYAKPSPLHFCIANHWQTANFPYLISPHTAIQNEVRSHGKDVEGIFDNYAYSQIDALAQRVDEVNGACIVFANSDSGEGMLRSVLT